VKDLARTVIHHVILQDFRYLSRFFRSRAALMFLLQQNQLLENR